MDSLRQALANTADGAFIIDDDQRITFWNQAAQEILGYDFEEVEGLPCYQIIGGLDARGQRVCCRDCPVVVSVLRGVVVADYDVRVHTKSGQGRWINVSVLTLPAPNDDGRPTIIHLFRDATKKKQNEQFIQRVLSALDGLQGRGPGLAGPAASGERPAKDLTNREAEVLSLLVQGLNTGDIAQSLSISPSTARNHIQNILHKLQVHSRLEAVAFALEHGLVTRD